MFSDMSITGLFFLQIDPLLQKLSKEGDSSFGGLLLSALRCADDDNSLMLNMSCNPGPNKDVQLHSTPITQFGTCPISQSVNNNH